MKMKTVMASRSIAKLNRKGVDVPVLFVVGSADNLLPPEHSEALYEAANEPKKRVVIEGANHLYSDHRVSLMQTVMAWFREHL